MSDIWHPNIEKNGDVCISIVSLKCFILWLNF